MQRYKDVGGPEVPDGRRMWAEVDGDAIAYNASILAGLASPTPLCAVVKADGYGHGLVRAAKAAVSGGASWVAVTFVAEAIRLRDAEVMVPILVLSEPVGDEWAVVVQRDLTASVYTNEGVSNASRAMASSTRDEPLHLHLKVDTGLHRLGAPPHDVLALAEAVARRSELALEGLWTHFATADQPGHPFLDEQARRFRRLAAVLARGGLRPPMLHMCNSAGTIGRPSDHLDLVRCGSGLYGIDGGPAYTPVEHFRPAMSVKTRVCLVQTIDVAEGVSYGHRYSAEAGSAIATLPVGYADGIPRLLGERGGQVLIHGRLCPIAGTISMNHFMVDCGREIRVTPGDEVVLIGTQGDQRIKASDWARWALTNPQEIACRLAVSNT